MCTYIYVYMSVNTCLYAGLWLSMKIFTFVNI